MIGVCDWFWRYALRAVSLSVFRSWSIVYGCTCSSCHIISDDIYICSIRHCGALLTWPDQWGVTSVLLVGGWTSANAGVFHWVRVASGNDGVMTGCPATSTLLCMSGLTASGWHSWMWSHACLYSAPPMTLMMYEPQLAARTTVAGSHSVLSLLITETDCPAYSGAFLQQPVWSWLAALWVAHYSNLSHSAAA